MDGRGGWRGGGLIYGVSGVLHICFLYLKKEERNEAKK